MMARVCSVSALPSFLIRFRVYVERKRSMAFVVNFAMKGQSNESHVPAEYRADNLLSDHVITYYNKHVKVNSLRVK